MSDVPQGPGWWLASDGKYYPPQESPPPPPVTSGHQWWQRSLVRWLAAGFVGPMILGAVFGDDDRSVETESASVDVETTTTTTERITTTTTEVPSTTTTAPPTTTTAAPTTTMAPPPPPPPTTQAPVVTAPASNCHPSYDPCVPYASDVDCAGGSGNGPAYTGPVRVIGPDVYDLDRDGDGFGCE